MSGKPIKVRVIDPETGDMEQAEIVPGDYLLICAEPCHLDGIQSYPIKGTVVLTIKGFHPTPTEETK